MRKIIIIIIGIFSLTGVVPILNPPTASAQASVNFQVFYDQLSPFGTWVSYPGYGYVWVPGADSGFRPYGTRGHWVYTDDGWAWVSDYSWGWATFHYGNWFYDNSYGWMWAPGYQWAPAWVTWGEYGGNYCWAPIGPRVDIGMSFGTYRPPYNYWNFCPRDRITSVNISHYYVTNIRNTTVVNHITVINNVNRGGGHAYLRGPVASNVERFTHSPVRPVAVTAASHPGVARVNGGQLAIYRPTVQSNNTSARPAQVRDMHALRPANRTQPMANTNNRPANPVHPTVAQRPATPARQGQSTPARPVQRPATVNNNRPPTTNSRTNSRSPVTTDRSRKPAPSTQPANRPMNHTAMQQRPVQSQRAQQRPTQPARPAPQAHPARPVSMPTVRNQAPPHQAPREPGPREHH